MASLRDAVKVYQDELRAGIAWIAFWREGRSWSSDYIYLEMDDTLTGAACRKSSRPTPPPLF